MEKEFYNQAVLALLFGSRYLPAREYLPSTIKTCRLAEYYLLKRGANIMSRAHLEAGQRNLILPSLSVRTLAKLSYSDIWLRRVTSFLVPWFSLPFTNRLEPDL